MQLMIIGMITSVETKFNIVVSHQHHMMWLTPWSCESWQRKKVKLCIINQQCLTWMNRGALFASGLIVNHTASHTLVWSWGWAVKVWEGKMSELIIFTPWVAAVSSTVPKQSSGAAQRLSGVRRCYCSNWAAPLTRTLKGRSSTEFFLEKIRGEKHKHHR